MIDPRSPDRSDDERRLLARAARWPAHPALADLTEAALRRLATQEGMEFATALLYDRIVRSPQHGPFIAQVAALPETALAIPDCRPLTVVVVPGAFYREDRHSGADGGMVLESVARLGCRAEHVPLRSFGALAANARILSAWLRERRDQRLVLISLSKGGAEVKLALATPGAAETFRNVTAWISLSGLLYGTPLVTWLYRQWWRLLPIRLLFWYRGYHFPALRELERGPGRLLDFELRPPAHLRVIHVVGFPLVRHLSNPLAARGYRRIGPLGPNDGGPILLADLVTFPGLIYPVWGADHYLRPAWDIRSLVSRLFQYVSRPEQPAPPTSCQP